MDELFFKNFKKILLHFCIFFVFFSAAPSDFPSRNWHVPAGWGQAGFEPGTADFSFYFIAMKKSIYSA